MLVRLPKSLLLSVAGMVVVAFFVYNYAHKEVRLMVDGKEKLVGTFARDVAGLLADAGVALAAEDRVEPGPETGLREDMTVRVVRAGNVTVCVGGVSRQVRTVPVTVRELLASLEVALGPEDRVAPGLSTVVGPGAAVRVTKVITKEEMVTEKIPFEQQRRQLAYLATGRRKTIQAGREGLQQVVFRVTYVDGVPEQRVKVRTDIVRRPVPQIIGIGTKKAEGVRLAARGAPESYREAKEMVATAYSLGGSTATGTKPGVGTVAVDPKVIPLGTRLYIEGYGYGRAEDVGGAIRGNRIDVFLDSEREARKWGRRKVTVYIL